MEWAVAMIDLFGLVAEPGWRGAFVDPLFDVDIDILVTGMKKTARIFSLLLLFPT